MRQWLGIGLLVVIAIAIFNIVSFVKKKHEDSRFRTALAAYRAQLQPGASRRQVEDYLRQHNMPFSRSCCKPGVFSDRSKIGEESPSFTCRNWSIYLEFKFKNADPSADVADGADILTSIDLDQDGVCL